MNKRGTIMDLVLTPAFITVVALGLVGLTILNSVYDVTSSLEYDEKFYAADNGLEIAAMYASPKDVNFYTTYDLPVYFGLNVSKNKVAVYGDDGSSQSFYFAESPFYEMKYKDFGLEIDKFVYYKSGNTLGVESKKRNPDFEPNLNAVFCEPKKFPKLSLMRLVQPTIGQEPLDLYGGDAYIGAQLNPVGDPIIKIYTNPKKESEQLACLMAQEFVEKLGVGAAIIPVNGDLVGYGVRKKVAGNIPAVFIDAHVPDTPQVKATILGAMQVGVNRYGATVV